MSYQWSRADEAIEVATGSTLDLGAVDGSVADDYKVEVSNAGELVGLAVITVTTASLTVELPPTITGLTESAGGGVDLTAKAVVGPE